MCYQHDSMVHFYQENLCLNVAKTTVVLEILMNPVEFSGGGISRPIPEIPNKLHYIVSTYLKISPFNICCKFTLHS